MGALKIRGILTPVCALAQNDTSIGGFHASVRCSSERPSYLG